jgi:pimeloyl-ACP methyl ester carboxylesterase
MLVCDEDGVLTWHLPEDVPVSEVATRGTEQRTYRLRANVPANQAASGHRGLIGALGKKLLKVLAFKLADKALGMVGDFFVSRWEEKHRPHHLRPFGPTEYTQPTTQPLDAAALAQVAKGRVLLFIHGTASQGHKAFGATPLPLMQELAKRYGGRVIAFEHPTLSVSPLVNAQWLARTLVEQLPPGVGLDVDIVAHSRGGLVARLLCEQASRLGLDTTRWRVGQAVLVATPNHGTALADRQNLNQFVDTLTNLLEFLPDNPATDTLEVLLTLLKQVAVGAMGGLDGLMSMNPQGAFLRDELNLAGATTAATYHALAANYEPTPGSPLGRFARDNLTDLVFKLAPNDLVVPTTGVFEPNGAGTFPIAEPVELLEGEGVDHSGYWPHPLTREAFLKWLKG